MKSLFSTRRQILFTFPAPPTAHNNSTKVRCDL